MAIESKPAFLSNSLWQRCLPTLRYPSVMLRGSPNGQYDPSKPLLSAYNALAFQALAADCIRICLEVGEDVGDMAAIRRHLGIHIDDGRVSFGLPEVLQFTPWSVQIKSAGEVNRRYQPQRGRPWGPSCIDDVLRRSAFIKLDEPSITPPQPQDVMLPPVTPLPQQAPVLLPTATTSSIPSSVCDTPIARRRAGGGSSLSPFGSPRPNELNGLDAAGYQDEDPFQMPIEVSLDNDFTGSPPQGQRHEGDSDTAMTIEPCTRCASRGRECEAPRKSGAGRKRRPACVQCSKSHTVCDMRLVLVGDEYGCDPLLDMLEELEEDYGHTLPKDVSFLWRSINASAKRLQEVEW